MKVLLLGGNGFLGPHVVKELEGSYSLRITDIIEIESPHETMRVDVSDISQVRKAAEGTDVIVNCSVLRPDRKLAFDVNTLGTYNAIKTAVELGHNRFINTGPHFTQVGPHYEKFDFEISEEVPIHSGLNLYAHSKSIGQEICQVFSDNHDINIMTMLFLSFRDPQPNSQQSGGGTNPFSVTFRDAARAIHKGLETNLNTLPSQCEIFFITTDTPHGRYRNNKAKRLLGWEPHDTLEEYWRKKKQ